jgi:diguanylate cyclase (GGDEF)-like protein
VAALLTFGLVAARALFAPDHVALILAPGLSAVAFTLAALLAHRHERLARWLLPSAGLLGTSAMGFLDNGLFSEGMFWLPIVPLVAVLLLDRWATIFFTATSVAVTLALAVGHAVGQRYPILPLEEIVLRWSGLVSVICFAGVLGMIYERARTGSSRKLEDAHRQTQALVEHLTAGVVLTDEEEHILSINHRMCDLLSLDLDVDELVGQRMWDVLGEAGAQANDHELHFTDGSVCQLDLVPLSEQGYFLWSCQDITAHKKRELHLLTRVHTDKLTGLASRDRFLESLEEACEREEQLGLLYVDLDGFKDVNDQHGHDAGDEVLRVIGDRLRANVRRDDIAARIGGDEFAVLLEGDEAAGAARRVAEKIVEALVEPIHVGELELKVGASVGVISRDSQDADELLKQADAAMYEAKRGGGGRVASA